MEVSSSDKFSVEGLYLQRWKRDLDNGKFEIIFDKICMFEIKFVLFFKNCVKQIFYYKIRVERMGNNEIFSVFYGPAGNDINRVVIEIGDFFENIFDDFVSKL